MTVPTNFTYVRAGKGFILPVGVTGDLPAAADTPVGTLRVVTDNGAGDDEFALVVNNGTAWLAVDTTALS